MDGGSEFSPLGQAGYAVGSVGDGAGGQYVFANLDQINEIIFEAETLLTDIRDDGASLLRAQQRVEPPAEDIMSAMEANATVRSLDQAITHNQAMASYVDAQLAKLRACRDEYARTDADGAGRLRTVDKG